MWYKPRSLHVQNPRINIHLATNDNDESEYSSKEQTVLVKAQEGLVSFLLVHQSWEIKHPQVFVFLGVLNTHLSHKGRRKNKTKPAIHLKSCFWSRYPRQNWTSQSCSLLLHSHCCPRTFWLFSCALAVLVRSTTLLYHGSLPNMPRTRSETAHMAQGNPFSNRSRTTSTSVILRLGSKPRHLEHHKTCVNLGLTWSLRMISGHTQSLLDWPDQQDKKLHSPHKITRKKIWEIIFNSENKKQRKRVHKTLRETWLKHFGLTTTMIITHEDEQPCKW